ncbi:hypothetical protein HPP92_001823 [Vanilla planifolia]|uniref:Uncharacterized protein n=1 Tax=Vanilla planifolia TaxID=51239 RepID=A0A835S505_VANPL|nr:hypothetical protein HPP92_001823 [Vanilla planifolia]
METIGFNNSSRAFLSPILPNSPAAHKFGTRISAARKRVHGDDRFNKAAGLSLSPSSPTSGDPQIGTRISAARKGSTVFPRRGGPRQTNNDAPAVKLLSNVEKLRLLTKAEKAGLLSLAGELGLHFHRRKALASSKAEELGVLSAVTDPNTPTVLLALSLVGSCWAPPASICAGGECRGGCRAGRRGLGERRRWIGGIRCVKLRGEIAEMLRFAHVVLEISLFQIQMF